MPCGPVDSRPDPMANLPFQFSDDPMRAAGWGTLTSMMMLPWRAAAVVTAEAMRDSLRHWS